MSSLQPRTGAQRPHFRRRKSRAFSDSESDGESNTPPGVIPHNDLFLDDRLPLDYFKQDVLRAIHKMHIPRWSVVTDSMAEDLKLDKITSALSNSVYSVKPPDYIKAAIKRENDGRAYHHKLPANLLLRIYGPQCDVLIDRQRELETIAQLTRLNLGARLMGTFSNGRFEQFLNARALSPHDLRVPETSIMIAKRMRDLHDNLPLTTSQRRDGPITWVSILRWLPAVKEKLAQLDKQSPGSSLHIVGTDVTRFFEVIESYRKWLIDGKHGGDEAVQRRLKFCHNDTQYGNLLRVEPPPGSPLLRPQNEHRQLVVIDFEYSGQNMPASDIANHFAEWMSDFHDPTRPHHIWKDRYPTKEEQERFLYSYVEHGTQEFDEAKMDKEVEGLLEEVKWWLPTTSLVWGLWGIIQVPFEQDEIDRENLLHDTAGYEFKAMVGSPSSAPPAAKPGTDDVEDEDEPPFDYLQYAREKLDLFWDDMNALGITNAE